MDNSSDIILKFQFVTDILGTDDVKMIVLSDEDNTKQFIMICDDMNVFILFLKDSRRRTLQYAYRLNSAVGINCSLAASPN